MPWDARRTWIEVRQQAAEEDLEMPVVLEEFGCKLDARPDQYRLAYDSCLTSAKRGGSCAGVMFWDLAHKVPGPHLTGTLAPLPACSLDAVKAVQQQFDVPLHAVCACATALASRQSIYRAGIPLCCRHLSTLPERP